MASGSRPIALLLVPRTVDRFIQYDQAQDLLRSPAVVAVEAPRIPYGVLGRLPAGLALVAAGAQARRLRPPGEPAAALVFHPFQWPFARAVLARWPGCELWYGIWDLYTEAHDAGARTRAQLRDLHEALLARSDFSFAISTPLAQQAGREGRGEVALWPSAADSFPAPEVETVAVSFGNLGRRTDWALLRDVARAMPGLVLLMVGALDEAAAGRDPAYAECRLLPNFVWLGRRSDEEAARLIAVADVGLLPFSRDPFNEAALPNRVLKSARLGVRTIAPAYPGLDVWREAVVTADGAQEWVAAIREQAAGRRSHDTRLRDWAFEQTGVRTNAPLWKRLAALGVEVPPDALDAAGARAPE